MEGVVDLTPLLSFLQMFQFSNPPNCMHQLFPLLVQSYLGSFNVNYITFRTLEIAKPYLFKKKNYEGKKIVF